MSPTRELPVVEAPHPDKPHVVDAPEEGPVLRGVGSGASGDLDLACGGCGRVLLEGMHPGASTSRFHVRCSCGDLVEVRLRPFADDGGDG